MQHLLQISMFLFKYPTLVSLIILLICILSRIRNRHNRIYLLNYSCYKPPSSRKCTYRICNEFVTNNPNVSSTSIEFMRGIYLKSGLGDETYAPQFIFDYDPSTSASVPGIKFAMDEAREGVFATIDSLILKCRLGAFCDVIDTVIVTSGSFSPSPSLASLIVNRYGLRSDVKTYNLSGMGCSSGLIAIDLAGKLLRQNSKSSAGGFRYALVVATESISANWYYGDNRSMLVPNCIFRVGCAAAILTNRCRGAKFELVDSLRTHHGASDDAYRAAFQEEDEKGFTGVSLTKDLIRVAGVNLRSHITQLAPRVLPLSQLVTYILALISARTHKVAKGGACRPTVPDFSTAFEHMCIHTGGKAVIEQVGRVLSLSEEMTEPARMSLHRFGNTSSSLVFYELAYFEAKLKLKCGDRMWMLAFGTGFKVGSLVWKSVRDCECDSDNPWIDCIDKYPVEAF